MELNHFIDEALAEDIGSGDHTTLSTIPPGHVNIAELHVKENGILSGLKLAEAIIKRIDPGIVWQGYFHDGDTVVTGSIAFSISGSTHSILKAERLLLNCMQRLSGIATTTRRYVKEIEGTKALILDTRKTTPLLRSFEKEAVLHGGGHNHRTGLYDMILIKDNHIDAAGGIVLALERAHEYRSSRKLSMKIEVETRNLTDVKTAIDSGLADRIMFDNFSARDVQAAVELTGGRVETEASGGITLDNIRQYAETGVDFISVGALTHSVKSMDLSLKIKK